MSSATVTISNSAPVLSSVSLIPDPAYEGDSFTCSLDAEAEDADGDSISYSYAWYLNGSAVSGASSSSFSSFDRDDSVYCRVTPSDGTDSGSAMSSSTSCFRR